MASLAEIVAASALITKLERIASSGVLSIEDEIDARMVIVKAARAFSFDSIAERPRTDVVYLNPRSVSR